MGIHQVSRTRLTHTVSTQQNLKPGQIIQGKILKIYPNNKAHIQLGSQKMVAQLEAPLSVGERYYFQVASGDDVIHLKVIGEPLKNHGQTNVAELLQTLGLKVSKGNVKFVQNLIYEKIPFDRNHLMQSFSLLGTEKNKVEAEQILKQMIVQRLPMSHAVFQAILTSETTQLSDQMTAVLEQLKNLENPTELQNHLLNRLRQMVELPRGNQSKVMTEIVTEVNRNNPSIFNTLKLSGLIDQQIDFSTWKSQWKLFAEQSNLSAAHTIDRLVTQAEIPFSMNIKMIEQALKHLLQSQVQLKHESQEILNRWISQVNESVIKDLPFTERNFSRLTNHITQHLFPLLTEQQQEQILEKLQNNPVQLRQLLTIIQQYRSEQTYTTIEHILTTLQGQDSFNILSSQEKFLSQVRQMLLFAGLTDENALVQDVAVGQQNETVKSILIQMIQQGDYVGNERVQQLLHHINGLQLQSVQEMGNFIQASLMIPGEKLLLNNDIYIEFESKKTEDGKINPDFCRILFYLDLAKLEETIIDMQIQKRLMTITIFNDHEQMKQQSIHLQPLLKKGLESLNYQLTNITVKPLQKKNEHQIDPSSQPLKKSYEGMEFRI